MDGTDRNTRVDVAGSSVLLNGRPTYEGADARWPLDLGLSFNARLVHAGFDDENPETVDNWAYPDTG